MFLVCTNMACFILLIGILIFIKYNKYVPIRLSTPNVYYDVEKTTLEWMPINKAIGYQIYIEGGDTQSHFIYDCSFDLLNLSLGTHNLKVRALGLSVINDSSWTKNYKFKVELNANVKLDKPVNLDFNDNILSWDSVPNAEGYEISANDTILFSVDNFVKLDVQAGIYDFKVKALSKFHDSKVVTLQE